ncbi:hypothetical protein MKK58_18425 [Methylobacterium sp. J-078]|uniref:hypothetical protein n=1 Tax=Methylobacterium sp. J-078 TaxID=2836657 RepID=UPI001FBB3007|nr:hypothetical protein [Methylobacterium sp. J-078]MCJ2046494.1 hypothetical protein [Methylobacterium sp. J-078]
MRYFDEEYYLAAYPDAKSHVDGALGHYLFVGWREGRDPSDEFSTRGYLEGNPDVSQVAVNPLLHFLEYGLAEGRSGWKKTPGQSPPQPDRRFRPKKD